MTASVLTYSPSDVTLLIDNFTIPAYLRLTLAWRKPPYTIVDGVRGATTRVRNKNSSAILSVEASQTSLANDILTGILQKDLATGQARLTIALLDLSGTTFLQTTQGYVSKWPDVIFSSDLNPRTWEITLLAIDLPQVMGNSIKAGGLFDSSSSFLSSFST